MLITNLFAETTRVCPIGSVLKPTLITAILVIALAGYIYYSWCLQLIAQKTGNEPTWWAWVPVANFFLMCKIAALNYWWLLVVFIPFVGGIAFSILACILWYKIALARNKPAWVCLLILIPLVNIFVIGYLAFSD